MSRITEKHLEGLVDRLNILTNSPQTTYNSDFLAQIGNYHISFAYGGTSLYRINNPLGGVTDVFSCGHITKKDLYFRIDAYMSGIELKP